MSSLVVIKIDIIKTIVMDIILLIVLIALLAGFTPTVLTYMDNFSATLVNAGQPMGSLLASNSIGGILWFILGLIIILGSIFLMIKPFLKKSY